MGLALIDVRDRLQGGIDFREVPLSSRLPQYFRRTRIRKVLAG